MPLHIILHMTQIYLPVKFLKKIHELLNTAYFSKKINEHINHELDHLYQY